MQLSEKLELFSVFFIAFFQSVGNFELFEQKISLIAQLFLKLLSPKDPFNSIYKRSCFRKLCESERVNESLKLSRSAEKYFYPTFSIFWVNFT